MTETNNMMTCEEYRQAIAANPSYDGGESHVSQCEACQSFRAEMQALDKQIKRALVISVPELKLPELAHVDSSTVSVLPQRRMTKPTWLAVAATFAVAAVLGFKMLGNEPSYPSLADEIIAHLEHEPYAFRVTDKGVSDARMARVIPAKVATMDHSNGLITYAQSCVINGTDVPHLVIQGERGPVTILLMPGQKVDGPQSFSGQSINGVILPVGEGSIAIVGEEGEDLKRIENNVKNSVTWST